MTDEPSAYEVLPDIRHGEGEDKEVLSASFTANNGIRLMIMNGDIGPDWAVFDLDAGEARAIGSALLRWAAA